MFSNDLQSQKAFYHETLGFDVLMETDDRFSLKVGWTILTFKKSNRKHLYHYCFLIPSNQQEEAIHWFSSKMDIIPIEDGLTYFFESWNAKSFYFYDGNGNLAECIVRYDLKNNLDSPFSHNNLLCVNEIGMPSNKIQTHNNTLEQEIKSYFWKGDSVRFATNGSQEGLFLLVNNEIKKTWFPTNLPTTSSPFLADVETRKGLFSVDFSEDGLKVTNKSKQL